MIAARWELRGSLATGQEIVATIEIFNVGSGTLDLAQVDPTLDPEFVLDYGTQQPIQPGEFGEFSVTFRPDKPGQVQSTVTVQTDGINPNCPSGPSSYNAVTVQLTGTGAAVDAGPAP